MKILWAPIVDAVFARALGRRKSWVVPSQFIIAIVLYSASLYIDTLLDSHVSRSRVLVGYTMHDEEMSRRMTE